MRHSVGYGKAQGVTLVGVADSWRMTDEDRPGMRHPRPAAPFLAQLIAGKLDLPAQRRRRQSSPETACDSYLAPPPPPDDARGGQLDRSI